MKKLYLQLITAFVAPGKKWGKAVNITLLTLLFCGLGNNSFAQVSVTAATGGSLICSKTAVTGGAPTCTTLNPMTITEFSNADFAAGTDQFTLTPPAGWQFCVAATPLPTAAPGGDVTTAPIVVTYNTTTLTIRFTAGGTTLHDALTISGLQVQPLTTSSAAGYIYATAVSGITGITIGTTGAVGSPGTDFGDLAAIPLLITGPSSVCTGASITLSDPTPGGTWTSGTTSVATVGSGTGIVTGVGTIGGTSIITYSVSGCTTTYSIAVNPAPHAFVVSRSICANGDTLTVHDVDTAGTFNSGYVTVLNEGGGYGLVTGFDPGTGTITYTLHTGCSITESITVNPLPGPVVGPDSVCQGSTIALTDTVGPGTWTSGATGIAIIGSVSGILTGESSGIAPITYTLATGCKIYDSIKVNPLPTTITGALELCVGNTTTLNSLPATGKWVSGTTSVATIDSVTGFLTAISMGTSVIVYTLPTGCSILTTETVDAIPGPITGPTSVCIGSTITLSDTPPLGTWTSSTTSVATIDPATGVLTGISYGTTTITYTIMPGSCFATYTVTVDSLPTPILGVLEFCSGSRTTLYDSTTGGRWSSVDSITIAFIDPTGIVTTPPGSLPGTDSIYYTLPTGCFVGTQIIVDTLPDPITGTDSICVGDTKLLFEITTGGIWISGNPAIDTINAISGSFGGISPGVVVDTYKTIHGCFQPYTITVNAIPDSIHAPLFVCKGQTVLAIDSTLVGTWSISDTTLATISSTGVITGISTGTPNITYTGVGGCYTILPINVNNRADFNPSRDSVCIGDTISLSNTVAPGTYTDPLTGVLVTLYSIGGSTSGLANVVGVSPGTETITYETAQGCFSYDTITVNQKDPITSISQFVCVNGTLVLSDSVTGGVWTSSDTSLAQVTTTTGITASVGTVTGISAGAVTISYTLPTGCLSIYQITVNPLPAPIAGPTILCQGATVILTDDSVGGTWTSINLPVATIDSVGDLFGVTAGTGGTDSTYYTLPTGCRVGYLDTVLYSQGIGSSATQVCVGLSLNFSDSVHGGTWMVTNTAIGTIDTVAGANTFTGIMAGLDTVEYITTTGCSQILPITVNPLPSVIPGPDSVCVGSSITLTDSSTGGAWSSVNLFKATIDPSLGIVTGVHAGVDTIIYTLPTNCLITTVVTVNPVPLPIVGDSNLCNGLSETLTETTTRGVWSITPPGVATIDTTGKVTAISVGSTVVTYTLATTCAAIFDINVRPIPDIRVNHFGIICKGASETLTAAGADTSGGTGTYVWSPSTGLTPATGPVVVASPSVTTTYTVTGTTIYGCVDTAIVTVLIDSTLNHLKIVGRDSICIGESDTLMASGRDSTFFAWHPIGDLSCTHCDTTIAKPTVTTLYTAVAIDDLGCADSVFFNITVNPIPIIKVSPNPAFVCRGIPTQLHATTTNTDNTTTIFSWTPNILISCDTCFNPLVYDTVNLVYKVIATSVYGCWDSSKIEVSVLDTNFNRVSNDTNICVRDSAQLIAYSHSLISNLDIPTYTWIPASYLNNAYIPDPVATPPVTTTYMVAIHENDCFSDTLAVTVFVQPYPAITLTTSPSNQPIVAGTPTQLDAIVTNTPVQSYVWTPATYLTCDTCFNPVATPPVNTTYTVTVTSIYGCVSSESVNLGITCDQSEVFIPNTFTPNGDGVNDRFYISAKGISLIKNFRVFNRWGQLLYETHNILPNDAGAGWDGTFKGIVLEPDVFIYTADVICELGGTFSYKGDISLVK